MRRALVLLAAASFVAILVVKPHATLEVCRVVNVPLGFIVAGGFFVRVNDAWARYGIGGRLVRTGVFLVLLVVAAGSAEAYINHAQLGYRSAFMTLALVVTGTGLLLIPHDDV